MKFLFYDSGEWNEDNKSCHREEDVRKPGIPKSTSTPLKHNIPSSSKRPGIIDTSSSMKALCSETTLNKEDNNPTLSNADMHDERVTIEKQKEIECEDDKMEVEFDVKMKEEENIKDDDDDDDDVRDLEICHNGDTRIKNKEENSEESEEEEEEETGDGDKSEKSSDDSGSERETEDSDEDPESEGL